MPSRYALTPAPLVRRLGRLFTGLAALVAVACTRGQDPVQAGGGVATGSQPAAVTLTLGAYSTPREAFGKAILPAFREHVRSTRQEEVTVRESYLGSGPQARAIVGGFEADVAALSLEPDIEQIRRAGLITHDWKSGPHGGMVTRSVVAIGVRPGNPKNVKSWEDLARPGVEVLTPNVRTSGGAMWNMLAIYGAALRGRAGVAKDDPEAARALLGQILRNVKIMDRSARDAMLTFERGAGDAIITYENEVLVGQAEGKAYELVLPPSTILIENPVAMIDGYADRHGTRALAESFVSFLGTEAAQRAFVAHGFRPVLPSVAAEVAGRFGSVADLFTIADLGGWAAVEAQVFAAGAAYDRALAEGRQATP